MIRFTKDPVNALKPLKAKPRRKAQPAADPVIVAQPEPLAVITSPTSTAVNALPLTFVVTAPVPVAVTTRKLPVAQTVPLTVKQQQILDCAMHSYSNQRIADTLQISQHAVKKQLADISKILGGDFQEEAVGRPFLQQECLRRNWLLWSPPWDTMVTAEPAADVATVRTALDYVLTYLSLLPDEDLRRSAKHHITLLEARSATQAATQL